MTLLCIIGVCAFSSRHASEYSRAWGLIDDATVDESVDVVVSSDHASAARSTLPFLRMSFAARGYTVFSCRSPSTGRGPRRHFLVTMHR